MSFIEWEDKFDIGVNSMNTEHRQLIVLMNSVHTSSEQKSGHQKILKDLEALGTYVIQHFSDEEAYMASIGFPGLDGHKRIHQKLLQDLTTHLDAFKSSGDEQLPSAFFSFLKLWLSAHIQGIDVKYGEHAKLKKAG